MSADPFEPITTQEALDKIIGDRLARERAKFQDYDQLKADAAELRAKAEAASEHTASILKDLDDARHAQLRAEVAAERGLPPELLKGNTREELQSFADQLATFATEKPALHVPKEGNIPQVISGTPGQQFGEFIRNEINKPRW